MKCEACGGKLHRGPCRPLVATFTVNGLLTPVDPSIAIRFYRDGDTVKAAVYRDGKRITAAWLLDLAASQLATGDGNANTE
ncbi:MAG: hypothetical protein Q7R41_18615 [Phycisphaerales bacterium]|nr:hypothetical protein [Phycisphaerales bacterium]